jgi:hypothetical protein
MQGLDVTRFVKRSGVKLRHVRASDADSADPEGAVSERFRGICHGRILGWLAIQNSD